MPVLRPLGELNTPESVCRYLREILPGVRLIAGVDGGEGPDGDNGTARLNGRWERLEWDRPFTAVVLTGLVTMVSEKLALQDTFLQGLGGVCASMLGRRRGGGTITWAWWSSLENLYRHLGLEGVITALRRTEELFSLREQLMKVKREKPKEAVNNRVVPAEDIPPDPLERMRIQWGPIPGRRGRR